MHEVDQDIDELDFPSLANQYFGRMECNRIIMIPSSQTLSILRTLRGNMFGTFYYGKI